MGCIYSNNEDDIMSLDFLVILKKKNLSKKFGCMAKINKLKYALKRLPGNIHLATFDDSSYNVKGLRLPRVLYIKLPKENIYVTSDTWDGEYFNSQILELVEIFTELGATEIKFSTSSSKSNESSIGASSSVQLPNVPINLTTDVESTRKDEQSTSLNGLIKMKSVTTIQYDSVGEFIKRNNLYYTGMYPEWRSLILFKLHKNVTILNFEFTFNRGMYCNTSIGTNLSNMGISCHISESINTIIKNANKKKE